MDLSHFPASLAPTARADLDALDARVAWLRDESEKAGTPEQRAAIRYELGVLEQRAGREAVAVRDFLAAVNAASHFREPLEHLIGMIERRRSFKNLPTLLEHLCRTADSAPERARANLAYAWLCISHAHDEERALSAARAAAEAMPDDAGAWLTLELLARRRGDAAALREALTHGAAAAADPVWADLLRLELSDLHADAGAYQRARSELDTVVARGGPLASSGLRRMVELGRAAQRSDWLIEALEAMVTRITAALDEGCEAAPSSAAPWGNAADAVHALLELSDIERLEGRNGLALRALERALALDRAHPVVVRRMLDLADASERHERLETLIPDEAGRSESRADAAALWLMLADSRSARNETAAALEALERAISIDAECWFAWARSAELLRGTRDSRGYAALLERLAAQFDEPTSKRRFALLAAAAHAHDARDAAGAARALAVAEKHGSPPQLVRRTARALARLAGDEAWYEAAAGALLDLDLSSGERSGLLLEAWRKSLIGADVERAKHHLDQLAALPEGSFISRVARAHALDGEAEAALALGQLEELEREPARAAALGWVCALRAALGGRRDDGAARLLDVHSRHPKSTLVAGTLSAWLAHDPTTQARSAAVLRATAAALPDDGFAASLHIECGLRSWRAGHHQEAQADFEAAERRGARCAWTLRNWARQAAADVQWTEPTSAADPRERLFVAFERAARAKSPSPALVGALNAALRAAGDGAQDDMITAARMASLFVGGALGMRAEPRVLDALSARGQGAARLADAWRFVDCVSHGSTSPAALEDAARRWAESGGNLAAVLQWVAAAARLRNPKRETEARHRLARQVTGSLAEQCASSAALIAHISQVEPPAFLDGSTPAVRLTNLETSPPGCDLRRRAKALDEAAQLLGEEDEPIARLMQGYNLLALGRQEEASSCFRHYAEAFPDDPAGFEGLLAAARHGDDPVLVAEATASLGNTSRDPAHAARLFEEAADVFFDRVGDVTAGQAALSRAVDLDISRSSSFARLFALVSESGDVVRMLELIGRRLPVVTERAELSELHWERARAARKVGDIDLALAALDALVAIEPQHLGALALYGEIYITLQRYPEAAEKLALLAAREDAPHPERLTSGLVAVDLFENQLGSTKRALEVLLALHRASLGALPVRERLARSAAKVGAWDEAVIVLEQLMFERNTKEDRAEAARLALAIHRDRRADPRSAGHAADVLLDILPGDAEALDLALSGALDPALAEKLLANGHAALRARLQAAPHDVDTLRRVSRIAERRGHILDRQITLGALVALGHGDAASRSELSALDRRIATTPAIAIPDEVLGQLADPGDFGPIPELLSAMQSHICEAIGPKLSSFEVGRRDRIAESSGLPIRNEIAAWVGGLGLGEFEVYRSGISAERVAVLPLHPLAIVIGKGVTSPLGPLQRQELARCLYAARRGLSALTQLDTAEVLAVVVALCKLGGVSLEAPKYSRQDDFERRLTRALPRKALRQLQQLALAVQSAQQDAADWVRAGTASLDRASAVATGDVSLVLDEVVVSQGPVKTPSERALRLLGFVLSPTFAAIRERLGVSVT